GALGMTGRKIANMLLSAVRAGYDASVLRRVFLSHEPRVEPVSPVPLVAVVGHVDDERQSTSFSEIHADALRRIAAAEDLALERRLPRSARCLQKDAEDDAAGAAGVFVDRNFGLEPLRARRNFVR